MKLSKNTIAFILYCPDIVRNAQNAAAFNRIVGMIRGSILNQQLSDYHTPSHSFVQLPYPKPLYYLFKTFLVTNSLKKKSL